MTWVCARCETFHTDESAICRNCADSKTNVVSEVVFEDDLHFAYLIAMEKERLAAKNCCNTCEQRFMAAECYMECFFKAGIQWQKEREVEELSQWRELHSKHVALVIPGETDSSDAYRKLWFDRKDEVARLKIAVREAEQTAIDLSKALREAENNGWNLAIQKAQDYIDDWSDPCGPIQLKSLRKNL